MQIKIQKNQIRFFKNQEVSAGVFKDVLELGVMPTDLDSPTYGVRVEVDVDTNITGSMISQGIVDRISLITQQRQYNNQARAKVEALPGVTSDDDYVYADIGG